MEELRKDAINTVYMEGDSTWPVSVTATFNGNPWPVTNNGWAAGRFSATLGYLPTEGEVAVTWNIGGVSATPLDRTDYYTVSTPYLTRGEIKRIWEEATDQEADDMEQAVRMVIDSHTGQSFGNHVGTKVARGTGQDYLPLPARLISVTSVSGFPYNFNVEIVGDGWYLAPAGAGHFIPPTRSDFDGVNNHDFPGINRKFEVPIRVPNWMRSNGVSFLARQNYQVTGTWGWKTIPTEVREAAKLLVNDYASGDTIYRDRYLTSMTAADWRIQFNSGAFAKTGNVRADHLLEEFVLTRGWAVL